LISIPIQKIQKVVTDTRAGFNTVVNDSLQNPATVIAYALEDELENRYVSAYRKFFDARMIFIRRFTVLILAGFFISTMPLIYIFIIAGFAVINETMLISEFIVYTGIGSMAVGWLTMLAQSLGGFAIWQASAKRLNVTTTGDSENLGDKKSLLLDGKIAVSFENISFSYAEDSPNALDNVSFDIPLGAKVTIIGGSGSGKSTVLKLLLGLYEPNNGKISVLGNDTKAIGKYALRDTFAYVPQDSFLFPVSIAENITGEKNISEQNKNKLEKVCLDAGILEFINSLPNGFDSILTESSENISGGQRQRIAMARAFYKDAPIILFDETTSALDFETEAKILKTLEEATKDKTVIMVAHRAAAKSFCDTVIQLQGGRIV
ncbi:MAG: ABC transporter ATP-binding protein/permease, partial [Oscillospiraceae bacterium]|nr:ABC transporter ATP-binding protein/permease [Oscillospiraceae bacterium]